ncbi:hypothetical protein Cob_v002167 [Colletotrichum orbiculare MAFF 240422]|uniref:Uncharacterized protein n=1 Tax=Colletotrichum orbiculare (strain 104-T / ATCC 96160 / CBS 514.97 / LARS 414 / MAFF 240422) TaxID=1213857 RepID=A0A484G3Y2_COLOR|nr:hypothetical protein Cob_v002167 [Colletotrichum orbiculare MAFF 240422]
MMAVTCHSTNSKLGTIVGYDGYTVPLREDGAPAITTPWAPKRDGHPQPSCRAVPIASKTVPNARANNQRISWTTKTLSTPLPINHSKPPTDSIPLVSRGGAAMAGT